MRRAISSVAFVVLTLVWCPISIAQGPASSTGWDTCHKAPTLACLLDEALMLALLVKPATRGATELGNIAEAWAAAGNIQMAMRVAQSIPSDQRSRVSALRSIASAQAHLGLTAEARDTFSQARQLADSLEDRLNRAEALKSVAQGEAEAGMAAEAASTFEASLMVAKALEIPARSPCVVAPSPEVRLEHLFKTLAEQQASAGNISDSLQTARFIKYHPHIRAGTLRMIAEVAAKRGQKVEAGLILKEALDATHASLTPPERWPGCPGIRHLGASAELYVETLSDVAQAQARMGLIEDAAATLEGALQFVPRIKDGSLLKADVSRSLVLTKIAEAQSEAGFGPQSAATFERAVQAASEVREATWRHIMVLDRLGRAQHKGGRVGEATRAFGEALALARALDNYAERASGLLTVLDAELERGLADADRLLLDAIEATRSIPEQSKRVGLLVRIAQTQEKVGRLQAAVDTYREALEAVDATSIKWARTNSLFLAMRAMPGRPQVTRLIAESAPQAIQIAESIEDELRRAEALVLIARALPN
jgi:tetratricopeptide (TPR) repeat protein